ncbi:hypothetical protein K523DRAFT_421790 [Schizophyllum commune Tattone D]|nr:hypothetical protein K523DRAFT_421790 [Schizophyllum commune Tattone D]
MSLTMILHSESPPAHANAMRGAKDSSITSVTVYNALSTPTVDAASAGFIPGPLARRLTNNTATRSLLAPVTRPSDLVLPYETDPSRLGSRAPSQAIYTLTDTVGLTFAPIRAHMTACLRSSTTATTATATRENVERGLRAQRSRRREAEDERAALGTAGQRLSEPDDDQRRPHAMRST